MRLLIFNPETEYALASGASFYTPPAVVESLRKANQLLPEKWAEPDDIILVDDARELVSAHRLADWHMLPDLFSRFPDLIVEPWGWNRALARKLLDHGVPQTSLPDESYLDLIRKLAHRRTSIILNKEWNNLASEANKVTLPAELSSEDECMEYYNIHPGCWMKAPWSSSGRGVINTAADMSAEQVRQWCHGIVRRQGCVIGETGARRVADFATEWRIERGVATYLGLSCFKTSNRGKYLSNHVEPQPELTALFDNLSNLNLEKTVHWQKTIIEKHLRAYSGPLGIDMIIESDGHLRPMVELNLRRTMGMLYI